jgi:hypothetical protein
LNSCSPTSLPYPISLAILYFVKLIYVEYIVSRRKGLEDACRLYKFEWTCDEFDKWMKEKEAALNPEGDNFAEDANVSFEWCLME